MNDLTIPHQLREAVVWVSTDEPYRTLDAIHTKTQKNVFVWKDNALSEYHPDFGTRLVVNGFDEDNEPAYIDNIPDAFARVQKDIGSCLCMFTDEEQARKLTHFIADHQQRWRLALRTDNLDNLPAPLWLISSDPTPPSSVSRYVTTIKDGLPTEDDLIHITERLIGDITINDSLDHIARAGRGLSEHEYTTTLLGIARNSKDTSVSVHEVSRRKREILKNSGILEVSTPKFSISDLGGMDNARDLIERIAWMWSSPGKIEHLNLAPLRRLLMVGVPGVGKSLLCEAIADALGVEIARGGVSQSMGSYIGESERNMRQMFSTLSLLKPVVFWIDEFGRDMSGGNSSERTDGGTTSRVHGEFLTGLQELDDNIFLAAAANSIDHLPPEMLRADRFDRIMFAGFPTHEERIEIVRIHSRDIEDAENRIDMDRVAAACQDFTGAEIKSLINDVRFEAGTKPPHGHPTTEDLIQYIPRVRNRIWTNHRDSIIQMYERARTEWHWASSKQQEESSELLARAKGKVTSSNSKMVYGNTKS